MLCEVGGRSSMVESKLVELVVAGSNPVGHPIFLFRVLGFEFRVQSGVASTQNAKPLRLRS